MRRTPQELGYPGTVHTGRIGAGRAHTAHLWNASPSTVNQALLVQRTPPSQVPRPSARVASAAAGQHRKDVLGRFGESVAAQHLRDDGLTILDRNWRCAIGEIDIVARERNTLVICEVKTRSSLRYGSPFDAITQDKLHRLERLAAAWIRDRGVRPGSVRIDALCVLRPSTGATVVEHIRDLH